MQMVALKRVMQGERVSSFFSKSFRTAGVAFAVFVLIAASGQADTFLKLDFTHSGGPVTTGYTGINANFLANTPTTGTNVGAYTFSVDNVASYDNGTGATEPLTASGFYTFGNGNSGLDHAFSLSGLNLGDVVTLYAVAAWDGNGRGGYVVFGSTGPNGVQAQTIGDPGTAPGLTNYTLIGTGIAGGSGILQGTLNGAAGAYTTSNGSGTNFVDGQEGQFGAFVFDIAPVAIPEPSTFAMLGLGGLVLCFSRRKKE
jgi:PEP-CTERM motif